MAGRRWIPALAGALAALVVLLGIGLLGGSPEGSDRGPARTAGQTETADPASGLAWVDAEDLPPEARDTLDLIDAGGPFPHDQDDETFFNREGLLPDQPEGYYREYTVETPGEDDRGARRIVAGDGGEYYWTADHYASFSRIDRGG